MTGAESSLLHPVTGSFCFGTKAETLERLHGLVPGVVLCDQEYFSVETWRRDEAWLIPAIIRRFPNLPLAVRSSSRSEDGLVESRAGAFDSVLGVECSPSAIRSAVERVIASFGDEASAADQILVQPMVRDVRISGVVFSHDITTGAPYFVINYDDFSGRTDTVTGGAISKLLYVERMHRERVHSTRFRRLLQCVADIEAATMCQGVDVEFCIDARDAIHVLQVRPLTEPAPWPAGRAASMRETLATLRHDLSALMSPESGLAGATTIFGEMPDWNPAEMIGSNPTPLAASLYRSLIMDRAWSTARSDMGYRTVAHPLMRMLAGRPYVDVRLSLNSFLPAPTSDGIAESVVNHQLDRLRANRHLHDKIEFEVALTCWNGSARKRLAEMVDDGVPRTIAEEYGEAVHAHTMTLLRSGAADVAALTERLYRLDDDLVAAERCQTDEKPFVLLEQAVPHGTMPFAKLARHAFIAVAQLRSFVDRGALSGERADEFLQSVRTVASDLVDDIARLAHGELARADFLARYGHLRPGTYDIRVPRYDEAPDHYLDFSHVEVPQHSSFTLRPGERAAIDSLLREERYPLGSDDLFAYLSAAIVGREFAKFRFSRNVSAALRAFCDWGSSADISRQDLAFLELPALRDGMAGRMSPRDIQRAISSGRVAQEKAKLIRLPSLVADPDEVVIVRMPLGKPTYITRKTVMGPTAFLGPEGKTVIEDRIVLIESADPGYDWIFSHRLMGLVTKFGGANSHMAIRCAEFGLPAAIGCGERMFEELIRAKFAVLDCQSQVIRARHAAAHA
ncbi:MAG: pyruvate, phosphate dikinase [Alphaproteobacteria bacterium]|nr:pyruvate, phosphate dikinase [Alphaproteobacteria bacterium]